MTQLFDLPELPIPSEADLAHCRGSGDYCPILFEWYKYVGLLCNSCSRIQQQSTALKDIPEINYYVLIGLLNRCSRLMLGNVALSHEGLFGETTSIIDRCICESAIKISWLSQKGDEESFTRYLAHGLKTELEFKEKIQGNIQQRGGRPLVIEDRMLASIENHIASSGLSEEQVVAARKFPDLASMIDTLGMDRLLYIVTQRIGSHHVHGTWPSLRFHYLEEADDKLVPRDHDCPTHVNQYVFVPLLVLNAIEDFFTFVCGDDATIDAFNDLLESIRTEIQRVNNEVIGTDLETVEQI
jgi:hypothetical protein